MNALKSLPLVIIGCVLTIAGSCMPWVTVTILGESKVTSGLDGDGVITLTLAVLALLLAFGKKKVLAIIDAILSGIAAAIGIYDLTQITGKVKEVTTVGMGEVLGDALKFTIGTGLYLVVAGSLLATVACILRLAVDNRR